MRSAIFALILLVPTSLLADGDCRFDVEAAQRLIAARTLRELDVAFTSAGRGDLPLVALYRSRRLTLNPSAAEELRYVRSLPASDEELFCVYRLTYPGPISETREVGVTVYEMFNRAAAITRRHQLDYTRVLRLALWADGELAAIAWDWYDAALREDTARVAAALRKLPADEQRRRCGGGLVRSLSDRAIAQRCQRDR